MKKQEQTSQPAPDSPVISESSRLVPEKRALVVGGCLLVGMTVLLVVLLWLPPATRQSHDPRVRLQATSPVQLKVGEFRSPVIRLWKQSFWRRSWDERSFVLRRYRVQMIQCTPGVGLSWNTWGWTAHRPGTYKTILHVKSLPWLSLHLVDREMVVEVIVVPKEP